MANIFESIVSVQSVALVSKISILSVAAHGNPTSSPTLSSTSSAFSSSSTSPPTSTPTPTSTSPSSTSSTSPTSSAPIVSLAPSSTSTPTPVRTTHSANKETHPATASPTHSAHATPVSNVSNGASPAVIAVLVVVLISVVACVGLLVWLWRRQRAQRRRRAQSGIWLEGPSYLANTRDMESTSTLPTYVPAGTANDYTRVEDEKHDPRLKNLPPPPPGEHEEFTPYSETSAFPLPPSTPNSFSPSFHQTSYPGGHANSALAYPTAAVIYGGVQIRPESGPTLLYSTPRNQDHAFGAAPPARPPSTTSGSFYLYASQHLNVLPPSAPGSPVSSTHLTPPPPLAVLPIPMPMAVTRASSPAGSTAVASSPVVTHNSFPVIRTYIPSLLDELKVSVGDVVRVIREYDDGWAYCERVGDPDGAAGVIPIECLDKPAAGRPPSLVPPSLSDQGLWSASSRISSFHIDFDAMRSSPVSS